MLHLIDFPQRFTRLGHDAIGSIDEVSWITSETYGMDAQVVPRGAVVFVRGWALHLSGSMSARTVVVRIDGVRTYIARVGTSRHDVADQLSNPGFAASGFEVVVPTGRLAAGDHQVEVAVLDCETGHYAELPDRASFVVIVPDALVLPPLAIRDGEARGNVDEVLDESNGNAFEEPNQPLTVVRGARVYLRGWACPAAPASAYDDLYAVVDGNDAFRATTGLLRPDVAEVLDSSNIALGFEISIPTSDLAIGAHDIELVGQRVGIERLDRIPAAQRIIVGEALPSRIPLRESTLANIDDVVRIERVVGSAAGAPLRLLRGDRLFVRGWAIDEPAASLAAGVVLVIDGHREVVALYGLPRADVADALGKSTLTRCGFTADIESDDIKPGLHTVACRVLARDGRGAYKTAQQFSFELFEI